VSELLRFFIYARSQWRNLAFGLVGALVEMVLLLLIPLLTREVVDRIMLIAGGGGDPYVLLNRVGLLLFVTGIARCLSIYLQIYMQEGASLQVAYRLRNDLYDKLQRLPYAYHDRARTGELMSRLTSDVEAMRMAVGFGFGALASNAMFLVGIAGFLFYIDWRFTLVATAVMPILMLTALKYARVVEPLFGSVQQQVARMTALVQENVTGVRVIKAFARENEEIQRFGRENEEIYTRNLEAVQKNALYHPALDFIANVGTLFVLLYGGVQVIVGRITIGSLIAFHSYLMMLIWPVRMMGYLLGVMQRARASAKRVFEILDTPTELAEEPGSRDLPRLNGQVRFENVSFGYSGDKSVIHEIDIDVEPGQTIALLGATGSGKTSIVNLIPRFYDPARGRVTVDGYDVRYATFRSLRGQIGIVLQESFLFSTTVRDNIRFGRPDASDEEVEAAARAAKAHDFIVKLHRGYDTVVGERGVGLSGGQRQRIAIARALLIDPRILILDDSTSSVDMQTEFEIQQALEELMRDRTTFIIAHRLSAVKKADQILVLDNGRIVERGNHQELLARGGIYHEIYKLQWENIAGQAGPSADVCMGG